MRQTKNQRGKAVIAVYNSDRASPATAASTTRTSISKEDGVTDLFIVISVAEWQSSLPQHLLKTVGLFSEDLWRKKTGKW